MALRHWLQLALTEGIGPILTARLIEAAGGAEAACEAKVALLRSIDGIGPNKSQSIFESLKRAAGEVDAELARAREANVSMLCQDDAGYPEVLKVIPDPPPLLYVRGDLQPRDLNAVAIVGSRRCSHYGREQADRFASLLAQAGITVVSGGARGIDSASHRAAMVPAQGRTIAVLGCGVDIAYPPENAALFEQISKRGAVVSEFPMGSPPLRENFPRRNRIISGLSRGVLVIEADVASGALITARQACDAHNRPVFAVPGRVDNPMSAGPHALIRDGAILAADLEDILEGLAPLPHSATIAENSPDDEDESPELFHAFATDAPSTKETAAAPSPDAQQQKILGCLEMQAMSPDGIIEQSGLPAEVVMRELTMLTLRGFVKRLDGQTFIRKR